MSTKVKAARMSIISNTSHPYGHGKVENVSGVIEALLIVVASIWIIYEGIKKLIHPEEIQLIL